MNQFALQLLCAALVPAAPALKPQSGKSLEALQGQWSVERNACGLNEVPGNVLREMSLTVRDEQFDLAPRVRVVGTGTGESVFQPVGGSYKYWVKLDPTTSPSRIDLELGGSDKPPVLPGIYQLDGDRLTIAYALRGVRPSKFAAAGRSEVMVLEFRRVKK